MKEDLSTSRRSWGFIFRVLVKASLLFVLFNVLFAALNPLDQLGKISIYNWLVPGRDRLPYGERPDEDYNLSLNNIPAMMSSHKISKSKDADEFRVVVIGDSGSWGWLLESDETLTGQLNSAGLITKDGRRIVFYNLAYPVMSVTKDLLLLDRAKELEPDLIFWPLTLQSLAKDVQLDHPMLQNNPEAVRGLISDYQLTLDPDDERLTTPSFFDNTIVGRRRDLADLIRLQLFGPLWAATGIDQLTDDEFELRRSDFDQDLSWNNHDQPISLNSEALSWDVVDAGIKMAGETPIWIINEPIFISQGENSDLRYNAWYPRWAYDDYRSRLGDIAETGDWQYVDLWDSINSSEFTDSPVHLTPAGISQLAEIVVQSILAAEDQE